MAIDFGGTNVRVLEAELDGFGNVVVQQMKRFPLVDPKGRYNYVCGEARAGELFGFIAERLGELAKPGQTYPLGHTFSFPCEQRGLNQASLIHWTKEFRTQGVEGQDIGALLDAALQAKGLTRIRGKAIINDTVGTLLAAAYGRHHVDVASICGTGHNTCYLQPAHPLTGEPMIVNMESGNFNRVPQSRFDAALDAASERPGSQRLEKMCSGYYLGEVVRLVLADLVAAGLLPASERLAARQVLGGEHLSLILDDEEPLLADIAAVAAERLGWTGLTHDQLLCIQIVVTLVAERSARLVAATFCGTIRHVDPEARHPHVVAVDGSLYEKLPGYAENLQHALDQLMPTRTGHVTTVLAKDGSGIGAAIAAATASAR
jgi:hexokinase